MPLKLWKWPVGHPHLLADLIHNTHDGRGRSVPSLRLLHDALGLSLADRRGAVAGAQEARDLRRVFYEVPRLVGQLHLHQHVAGEELVFGVDFLAAAHLDHIFRRDKDLVDLVGKSLLGRLLLELLGDLLLETRIDMHDIPTLGHHSLPLSPRRQTARERRG